MHDLVNKFLTLSSNLLYLDGFTRTQIRTGSQLHMDHTEELTLEKLKIGVIGIGHLGRLHTMLYKQIPQVDLVGIHDIDFDRMNGVAAEFDVPAYSNLDDLLSRVDAVSVVVPTTQHYDITKKLLHLNKHCLIEKPITSTVAQADHLIEIAQSKDIVIQIGHIERFNPAIIALSNFNLNPMFIESHRLASYDPRGTDVAVVLDLMIHDIDIILHLVKSNVKTIDASGVAVLTNEVDIANARIQFENGAVANVTASRISQKKMRKMRLFQKNAYIAIDFLQKFSEIFRLVDIDSPEGSMPGIPIPMENVQNQKKIIYEKPNIPDGNALLMELSSFVESVQQRKRPAVSAVDGREALRIAIEITTLIKNELKLYGINDTQ